MPMSLDLAKTDEARQLLKAGAIDPAAIVRVYVTTPRTPKDRLQILRAAFAKTLTDPDFIAEAKKANLDINPLSGEEVKKIVDDLFKLTPAMRPNWPASWRRSKSYRFLKNIGDDACEKCILCRVRSIVCVVALLCVADRHDVAAQGAELKPEKNKLEVAIAATGPLYLPIILANEAGYFSKRGVTVNLSTLSATASAQALLSGQVDIYQGGTATIHANVAGSDLIYIAAAVDRSTLILFGQKGLTTFENLRGKSVATTSVGAFGEIAMRKTAKERGMEIGKDIKLLYHKGPPDALSTFLVGNADGLIVTPPQTEMAREQRFSDHHRLLSKKA